MATKKTAATKRAPKTLVKTGAIAVQLERVRQLCLALPGTFEKLSHGEPTFWAGKRQFAAFSDNHHGDGHIAVLIPAADGEQQTLIEEAPEIYYKPPYVGAYGWVGVDLDRIGDEELAVHLHGAWKWIMAKQHRGKLA